MSLCGEGDNPGPLTELCNLDKGLLVAVKYSMPDIGND